MGRAMLVALFYAAKAHGHVAAEPPTVKFDTQSTEKRRWRGQQKGQETPSLSPLDIEQRDASDMNADATRQEMDAVLSHMSETRTNTTYVDQAKTACEDVEEKCAEWGAAGECEKNPSYMNLQCMRSCGKCPSQQQQRNLATALLVRGHEPMRQNSLSSSVTLNNFTAAEEKRKHSLGVSVTLNNGITMPTYALGTWQLSGDEAKEMVATALDDVGVTHIDTAITYGNHVEIGEALQGRERSSFFLTTKIDPHSSITSEDEAYTQAKADLVTCLTELDLDHVDLMLIHWPAASCEAVKGMWRAAEEFYNAGKARSIGVSNYCPSTFDCMEPMQTVVPAVNQVQYHVGMGADPGTPGIASYCDNLGIVLQAYSPLGDGQSDLLSGELVTTIGAAHGKSGAQVSQRWIVQHDVTLTSKTTSEAHLEENADIFDWSLTDQEMAQLDAATAPGGSYSFGCTS